MTHLAVLKIDRNTSNIKDFCSGTFVLKEKNGNKQISKWQEKQ